MCSPWNPKQVTGASFIVRSPLIICLVRLNFCVLYMQKKPVEGFTVMSFLFIYYNRKHVPSVLTS